MAILLDDWNDKFMEAMTTLLGEEVDFSLVPLRHTNKSLGQKT
ncbi:MAG: hypothetical protein SFU83_08355 [Meiothermus sp.]|nr:hypothetical protein [Meiothermus sp.]